MTRVFCPALLLLLVTAMQREVDCSTSAQQQKLVQQLMCSYRNKLVAPDGSSGPGSAVMVNISFSLIKILEADFRRSRMIAVGYLMLHWNDSDLSFQAQDDVNFTRLDASDIWTPDIELYYSEAPLRLMNQKNLVSVYNTGEVLWIPYVGISVPCTTNITSNTMNCSMHFGSWTYNGNLLDLGVDPEMDLTEYIADRRWTVRSATAERRVKYYASCPEPYLSAVFTFNLTRTSTEPE